MLMLTAFVAVIVLGIGGIAGLYFLATGGPSRADPSFTGSLRYEWPMAAVDVPQKHSEAWRGFLSAGLALAAVLLGGATFFSSRVSRPITRMTKAARTMAGGDLNVRVQNCAIREINELADAFNTMAASLSQADLQRRQMTADVAHELRTPLSIIRGRLEGMQDGVYSATPEQISVLLDETAMLERLIDDLRLLALADAGQLPLYPDVFSPSQVLSSVAQSFEHQAQASGISLQVYTPAALPDVVADPQRVSQVLANLVSNALRHTPPGGRVSLNTWVDTSSGGPSLGMAVSDTGRGISQEELPFIFERFWKADRSRSRGAGGAGAGLGLAIARRIVEAHGGRIWAESAPGQGTTVAFTLPLTTPLPFAYVPPAGTRQTTALAEAHPRR